MMMPPRVGQHRADVLPYNATETKLPVAAIHTGHVLRKTVREPLRRSITIAFPNQKRHGCRNDIEGEEHRNAQDQRTDKRLTGLIFATNHDGDAGFVSLRRSLVGHGNGFELFIAVAPTVFVGFEHVTPPL